jgi:GNAT superfamily N-acetyltransferase
MQAFLAAQGMTPISTASLGGALFPAAALGVADGNGKLVAVGWGAMSQNRFSNHAKCAWAGLFAVAPEAQGNGLGKRINAEVLRVCLEEFDADAVMEFAALGNAASISMITSVGLQQTDRVSAVAMLGGERSFTR